MSLRQKSETYRAQLTQMCRTLVQSAVVSRQAPALYSGAQRLREELRSSQQRQTTFRLDLDPNWTVKLLDKRICGAPGETELHFGGEIVFQDGCLERQVLTVVVVFRAYANSGSSKGRPALVAGENHVVRRFHFDFDRTVTGRGTPLGHLQVGGQLKESALSPASRGSVRYELFDQLDLPRLPCPITDLPIVLDTFLRQFHAGLDELLGGRAWRKCVMDSERLWLADYFRRASDMMASTAHRTSLFDYLCTESAYR